MTSQQFYLTIVVVVVVGIGFVAFLLRDRITNFFVKTKHGQIGIQADKPVRPAADLQAQNVTAVRGDANVIDEMGGTIDAKGIKAGQNATVTRKGPPKP